MELDHLADLASKATPRPWVARWWHVYSQAYKNLGESHVAERGISHVTESNSADAAFIAALANAAPALIAAARERDRLRFTVERLEAEVEAVREDKARLDCYGEQPFPKEADRDPD